MASRKAIVGSFIEDAPPGELHEVVNDIKILTNDDSSVLQAQAGAFKKYNEEQFTTVKLPGASSEVLITPYNSLGDGRYYDVESQTSYAFDHATQKASSAQSHSLDSQHADLVKSLQKSLTTYASEHFPSYATGVFPIENESKLAIVLVANKYSPNNFWNGRYRSSYTINPTNPSSITGKIQIDVHYYEDGNVRLATSKDVDQTISSGSATEIVRVIAKEEKKYQEDVNRGFNSLSEGAFKGLRRQLPVTRQKVDWEKIGGYKDIGGYGRK